MKLVTARLGSSLGWLAISSATLLALPSCSDDATPGSAAGGNGGSGLVGAGTSTGGTGATAAGSSQAGANPGSAGSTGGVNAGTGGTGAAGTGTAGGTGTGGANAGGTGMGNSGGTSASGAGAGGVAAAGAGTGGAGTAGAGGTSSEPVFHIFMLMGQSNMAGVAKNEASDKNTDARLLVWGGCNQPAGKWNTANPPLNDCPGEKGWNLSDSVDPGIWFGKTMLGKLRPGDTIGLVGTAESGESINTFITGGSHHQMILNKIAAVKGAKNARFAGVIFHQGESDSGQSAWPGKVVQLYNEVKAAFGVSYDVPFILGELPQGGCCGGHNTLVHQAADMLPKGAWVSQDGTKVLDQYHFDHASVVIMGKRYGDKMIEKLGW